MYLAVFKAAVRSESRVEAITDDVTRQWSSGKFRRLRNVRTTRKHYMTQRLPTKQEQAPSEWFQPDDTIRD